MSGSNVLHYLNSIPEELESEETEGWLNSGRLSCPCDGVAYLPIRDAMIGCSNGVTSPSQTLHVIKEGEIMSSKRKKVRKKHPKYIWNCKQK